MTALETCATDEYWRLTAWQDSTAARSVYSDHCSRSLTHSITRSLAVSFKSAANLIYI